MMFDKDNTNFNGECLCFTCKHKCAWNIGHEAVICRRDSQIYKKVGVCKYYEDIHK